jgi:hypothetical protein
VPGTLGADTDKLAELQARLPRKVWTFTTPKGMKGKLKLVGSMWITEERPANFVPKWRHNLFYDAASPRSVLFTNSGSPEKIEEVLCNVGNWVYVNLTPRGAASSTAKQLQKLRSQFGDIQNMCCARTMATYSRRALHSCAARVQRSADDFRKLTTVIKRFVLRHRAILPDRPCQRDNAVSALQFADILFRPTRNHVWSSPMPFVVIVPRSSKTKGSPSRPRVASVNCTRPATP